ncbi:MAG: glycosyltransferase [Alphaproteobacteria bacterium]|nr:glycosyltransferase [Alphaproteobacteria bacterium]
MAEPVAIAIMAKAPIPGAAKTRLIPALGAEGAAALASQFIERTCRIACEAAIGPVTLWCAPDETHPHFVAMKQRLDLALAVQPDGDLGARMHAAVAANGLVLVIGTDCPALTADHLRQAADALRVHDAVAIPTEDGGYFLIGLRRPQPTLFSGMTWSVPGVMEETRSRLRALELSWRELETLWDVDTPEDLERMKRESSRRQTTPRATA